MKPCFRRHTYVVVILSDITSLNVLYVYCWLSWSVGIRRGISDYIQRNGVTYRHNLQTYSIQSTEYKLMRLSGCWLLVVVLCIHGAAREFFRTTPSKFVECFQFQTLKDQLAVQGTS